MDQVNFGYSTKNINIPSEKEFIIELIKSVEKFARNIKWRAHHYLNPTHTRQSKETFGFNSTNPPPKVAELDELQDMLFDLVVSIKFKNYSNAFQAKLKKDIKDIAMENKMFIPADKTTNFYKISKETHDELLDKNINKDYKKANNTAVREIAIKDKEIASNLELDDRIYTTSKRQAFMTLKDHKPNFQNVQSCRLLNPTKTELGQISKKILGRILSAVRSKTNLNQWKNTKSVIDWFKGIPDKKRLRFIQFDIVEYYPSITKELLAAALEFAEDFINISDEDREIILHTKKSLLFDKNIPWTKKGNSAFDVGMGSFDSAEVCELVGLFLLSKLQNLNINLGLYRDDGLGVCNLTARQIEKTKKEICKIFNQHNLKITTDVNHKIVNFLDVTFDLNTGLFKPFMKPNDTPLYVNKNSNHPPSITRNLPLTVNRRLSSISANEEVFKAAIPPYQKALADSGYSCELKFEPDTNKQTKKKNRSRNITWFNPPYSVNVSTKIGHKFLQIIDTCFPNDHILHKVINRNTVKVSYRCMPNMRQTLSKHNARVSKQAYGPEPLPGCNCKGGTEKCPLGGHCLTEELVYQATVTRTDTQKKETYTGLTGGPFKTRYNKHQSDFRNLSGEHATTLSKYVWELKRENAPYEISWKKLAKGRVFNPVTKTCQLCLKEKYLIMFSPEGATLNKRTELYSTCRHRLKLLLGNLKT